MKIPPPEFPDNVTAIPIPVLAVTPSEQDHDTLDSILPRPAWTVQRATAVSAAMAQLRKHPGIPVVLCERDLWPGSWQDMLNELNRLRDAPLLIVASRFADEQLWAEALNLGAYDVLAKPFDRAEVTRTLRLASHRWQIEHQRTARERQEVGFASGM